MPSLTDSINLDHLKNLPVPAPLYHRTFIFYSLVLVVQGLLVLWDPYVNRNNPRNSDMLWKVTRTANYLFIIRCAALTGVWWAALFVRGDGPQQTGAVGFWASAWDYMGQYILYDLFWIWLLVIWTAAAVHGVASLLRVWIDIDVPWLRRWERTADDWEEMDAQEQAQSKRRDSMEGREDRKLNRVKMDEDLGNANNV